MVPIMILHVLFFIRIHIVWPSSSYLHISNFVWPQNSNGMTWILTLQKRPWELLISSQSNCHSGPLFLKLNLLSKFNDKVLLKNMLLISKYINSLLASIFNNWFTFCFIIHNYETTSPATCKLVKLSFLAKVYGKNSLTINAIYVWN